MFFLAYSSFSFLLFFMDLDRDLERERDLRFALANFFILSSGSDFLRLPFAIRFIHCETGPCDLAFLLLFDFD